MIRPLSHRLRCQRIQNLARRFVSPGGEDRPIPGTQKPAFPSPPRALAFLVSILPPCASPGAQPLPHLYLHTRARALRAQIPFPLRQVTARGWPLAHFKSRALWNTFNQIYPRPSVSSSTPPATFPSPNDLLHPPESALAVPAAQSRKPLQGFHYRVGGGIRRDGPAPAALDRAPAIAAAFPPTSHPYFIISAPIQPPQAG